MFVSHSLKEDRSDDQVLIIKKSQIVCPLCGFESINYDSHKVIPGNDNYQAWEGRGDLHKMQFTSGCGCIWVEHMGIHKDSIFKYLEILEPCVTRSMS